MGIRLSEYEVTPGFNRVASALFKENGINPNDFEKLFPDQVMNLVSLEDFFLSVPVLKNTEKFVERIKNFSKFSPICIYGDYDADRNNGYNNYVS